MSKAEQDFEEDDNDEDWKMFCDHCHLTGKFQGAAHNKGNLRFRKPKILPVIFHNFSGYDSHLFINELARYNILDKDRKEDVSKIEKIDCIPNNEEKYISFSKHVIVNEFTPKRKEREVNVNFLS